MAVNNVFIRNVGGRCIKLINLSIIALKIRVFFAKKHWQKKSYKKTPSAQDLLLLKHTLKVLSWNLQEFSQFTPRTHIVSPLIISQDKSSCSWIFCQEMHFLTLQFPQKNNDPTQPAFKRRHWCRSVVCVVNFEHISHLVLLFILLTLNM